MFFTFFLFYKILTFFSIGISCTAIGQDLYHFENTSLIKKEIIKSFQENGLENTTSLIEKIKRLERQKKDIMRDWYRPLQSIKYAINPTSSGWSYSLTVS